MTSDAIVDGGVHAHDYLDHDVLDDHHENDMMIKNDDENDDFLAPCCPSRRHTGCKSAGESSHSRCLQKPTKFTVYVLEDFLLVNLFYDSVTSKKILGKMGSFQVSLL